MTSGAPSAETSCFSQTRTPRYSAIDFRSEGLTT